MVNRFYYGKDVKIDDEITLEWARIPHFFYHYYVYQYATGFAVAIALSRKILEGGASAAARYIDFLTRGDSDFSLSILKDIAIDPTTSGYLEATFDLFDKLLEQFQNILK
jgi:oligoendopeptidase F